MMRRIFSFWWVMMVVLFTAGGALAQTPDVRAWISGPRFITPGSPTEYLQVNFRNKGDAVAQNTVITITLPPGVSRTGGSSNPYNAGDVGVSTSVYSYSLTLLVGDTVAVGTPLTVTAECNFDDGMNPYTTTSTALIDVVQFPVNILVPGNMVAGRNSGGTRADYSPDSSRIVYSGLVVPGGNWNDQEIFTVDPDGSGLMRLTFNASCDQKPSFSPDGTMIVWQHHDDVADLGQVWVMNSDGSNPHAVTGADGAQHPVWTPDGRILFRSGWCNTMFPESLWIVNSDGSNLQMISVPGLSVDIDFDAESSGRYVITRNRWGWGVPQIQLIDLQDPANPVLLEPYGLFMCNNQARFQPGTQRFVFKDRSPSWYCQLYSMNLDGSEFMSLTNERVENEYQLSDDGMHVTLDHDYILNVKGVWLASDMSHSGTNYMPGGEHHEWGRQITLGTPLSPIMGDRVPLVVSYTYIPGSYCSSRPNFSADGQWISYRSNQDGYHATWVMRWDGSMKTRLTFDTDDTRGNSHRLPAIRPDRNQVLFTTERDGTGNYALAIIDVDIDSIPSMPHAQR